MIDKYKFLVFFFFFALASIDKVNSQSREELIDAIKEANEQNSSQDLKNYSEIIDENTVTDQGLFDVHKVDEKFYFEINDSLLNREFLMVTRIVKMAKEIPLSRHKMSEQVLRWEKFNNKIEKINITVLYIKYTKRKPRYIKNI